MMAAVFQQGSGFSVCDVPIPEIGPDDLLVRVEASAICGTDLRVVNNGQRKLTNGDRVVLGHEFTGVVEKAGGRQAAHFPEGVRIGVAPNIGCGRCRMCAMALPNMCPDYRAYGINIDGAHAEYVRVVGDSIQQGSVMRLPQGVSPEAAALIEPLSCAVNGNRSVRIGLGDRVVIFGAGPIGLFHVMLARNAGASLVAMVEAMPHRLEAAADFGADLCIDAREGDVVERILAATNGEGADAAITACSVASVQQQALELLAPLGRVCLFGGLPKGASVAPLDTNLIHYKNLVMTGMTGGAPADFRCALNLIVSGRIDVTRVISHRYPIAEVGAAYDTALRGEGMKIVLEGSV